MRVSQFFTDQMRDRQGSNGTEGLGSPMGAKWLEMGRRLKFCFWMLAEAAMILKEGCYLASRPYSHIKARLEGVPNSW